MGLPFSPWVHHQGCGLASPQGVVLVAMYLLPSRPPSHATALLCGDLHWIGQINTVLGSERILLQALLLYALLKSSAKARCTSGHPPDRDSEDIMVTVGAHVQVFS